MFYRKLGAVAAAAVMALGLVACSDNPTPQTAPPSVAASPSPSTPASPSPAPCVKAPADMGGGKFATTPAWVLDFCEPKDITDAFVNETGRWDTNGELETYTDGNNVSVQDGKMVLEARSDYTSSRMISKPDFSPMYGKLVWRGVTMPPVTARGSWPALWFWTKHNPKYSVGTGHNQVKSAKGGDEDLVNGELDIVEYVPNDENGNVNCSAHSYMHYGKFRERSGAVPGLDLTLPHDYWVERTPKGLKIGIDKTTCQVVPNNGKPADWPYDQPMSMVINLAIGGDWGGPVDEASFPWRMTIDAIQFYAMA